MFNSHYKFHADTALRVAIDEYKSLTERINNTVKCITSLLICLGGIVTAVAALFTAYCICMPKNTQKDYTLFILNIIFVLATFLIDCYGIYSRAHYRDNNDNGDNKRSSENKCKTCHTYSQTDGYINDYDCDIIINDALTEMDKSCKHKKHDAENNNDLNQDNKDKYDSILRREIEMYVSASRKARHVLKWKRMWLVMSMCFTFLCILILGISVGINAKYF